LIKAELILLSMGFVSPEHEGLLNDLQLEYDPRGNVKTGGKSTQTTVDKVFACGDAQRGASLVVHAIASGRQSAEHIDVFLMSK